MSYLYDTLIEEFGKKKITSVEVPNCISGNLKYEIRPYQKESFQRFILCFNEDFDKKPNKPYHLLYNMATGSGKTFVMAGLILYLYSKGYRNFLFFVNSNNIIQKTKDNFLNLQTSKYLFKDNIIIDGKEVLIKEVDNFEEADDKNININFTTIQQLHIDLDNERENSVTYEDFKNKKIVLIADEAHHLNSGTKNRKLLGSWEGTIEKVLNQNLDNILLEFTATLDYETKEIVEKYKSKVIQKYDLSQFRIDKYSKEINLIRSFYDERERIIQALILNLYRQELATLKGINLKPVILFKAKKTIKESERNKENFHKLIADFSVEMVDHIRQTSTVDIVKKAFNFFETHDLSSGKIVERIKSDFREENCISANNDTEAKLNQIKLNTLEDNNNPIRAVFAVQKLNEGWDVLNLFDIVRLYEGQNTGGKNAKIGKTTLSEAQLIGRGARYFPFKIEESQDEFKRKFDDDVINDFKILEELYYHTKEDSRYISELKKALIESGIYEDDERKIQLKLELKQGFKKTDFYKKGKIIFNQKVKRNYSHIKSFAELGISKKSIEFILSSGTGQKSGVFDENEKERAREKVEQKEIKVSDIPKHIIKYALTQNPFYYFDNLKRYFPNIESLSDFIESSEYLGGIEIILKGTKTRLANVSNLDYLSAVQKLLQSIEIEVKSNLTEYEGTDYISKDIRDIFKDKVIKVAKNSERSDGQLNVVKEAEWYVYNANYGTIEEKEFVEMFAKEFEDLKKEFEDIYLIRNERVVKIIDRFGRAFEPDFILFCKQKEGDKLIYQVFIESKAKHLKIHDKWKEDFLKEIKENKRIIKIESDKYLITGVSFYNNIDENKFKKTLEKNLF